MKQLVAFLGLALMLSACDGAKNFGLEDQSSVFGQNVAYNNKVDILWVMDNSSSMQQHQTSLSQQVPALVSKLNALKMDYHMGVVTTSMGLGGNGGKLLGSPAYMTNSTANLSTALANLLVVGQNGSNLERGIDSVVSVLDSSNSSGGQATGFLRSDAFLAIIVLSDEDDQSARSYDYTVNFLDTIKPRWKDGTRSWSLNFIGVLADSAQCRTFNNYSDPGLFYMSLADASNGVKESICSADYTVAVSNIRARIVEILSDFKLAKIPDVSTIRVTINGQVVPQSATNGWTYETSGNLIRFHGTYVPPADAVIKVDFTPATAS